MRRGRTAWYCELAGRWWRGHGPGAQISASQRPIGSEAAVGRGGTEVWSRRAADCLPEALRGSSARWTCPWRPSWSPFLPFLLPWPAATASTCGARVSQRAQARQRSALRPTGAATSDHAISRGMAHHDDVCLGCGCKVTVNVVGGYGLCTAKGRPLVSCDVRST